MASMVYLEFEFLKRISIVDTKVRSELYKHHDGKASSSFDRSPIILAQ